LAGSLSIAFAAVVAFGGTEDVGGFISEVLLLTAVSSISLAESEPVAGSTTIAVAVVAASGKKAGFLDEVDGACAGGLLLAGGSVESVSASAGSLNALSVVTAFNIQAEILNLASVTEPASRAGAFSFTA